MLSRACAESRSLCRRAGLQAAAGRDGAAAGQDPRRTDRRGRVLLLARATRTEAVLLWLNVCRR